MLQNICLIALLSFSMNAFAGLENPEEFVPVEEAAAANILGATNVAPVYFRQTQDTLSNEERKALQAFVAMARSKGKIGDVKVLAWADREYPLGEDRLATPIQVQLADTRAQNIQRFLREHLDIKNSESFNMAERPTTKDELMKTNEYKVKNAMEITGVAPKPDETGAFYDLGKGSSALVFLKVEGTK